MLTGAIALQEPAVGSQDAVDEALELGWDAPSTCPSEAAVMQRIERALSERGASPHGANVDVRVTAESGGGYVLSMQVRLGRRVGRRTLEGDDCDALADVAVLVVAIALDPSEAVAFETLDTIEEDLVPTPSAPAFDAGDEPEHERVAEPSVDATPGPVEPRREPSPSRPRPSFFGQVGAGVGVGMLPSVGPSIDVALGPRGRHWMATLGATYWFQREGRVPEHPEVGGELRLWSIDARGCGIPTWGMLAFPLCAGLAAGVLHGRGIGELEPRTARSAWAAVRAGPGLEVWPLRSFGLWIRAEGAFVVARPAFEVPNRGPVCCANVATLDAAIGAAVRFP